MTRRRQRSPLFALPAALAVIAAGTAWLPGSAPAPQVSLGPEVAGDPAVALAAERLQAALPRESSLSVTGGLAGSATVAAAFSRAGGTVPALTGESYVIQPVVDRGEPRGAVVAGGSPLGLAHGLLALAEDQRLDRAYLRAPLPQVRTPAIAFRLVSDPLDPTYPAPEDALAWGFNAVMTVPWPALALFDGYDRAIYDPATRAQERAWVEERRRAARAQLARAKALHLRVIAPGDVVSLPTHLAQLYGTEVAGDPAEPRFCIDRPRVQALLAAALDEVFRDFPEIDGIMVRTGENYALGPLSGNTPQDPRCTTGRDPYDAVVRTMQFMQQQVTGKHGRLLIQRAWDLGSGGGHAGLDPARRLAAAGAAGPAGGPPPLLSFKVTETDFWRYNRLNPNLRGAAGPRMIEFQAAREYEGKGAFPNYTGALYAAGLPELAEPGGLREAHRAGVEAAWVWAKGGGWDGPAISSRLWLDANVHSLSRLLWDPDADPAALALDWSRLQFGDRAAPAMAALLQRSAEASLLGFYLRCYATRNESWTPNLLWVRDDIIAGGERMAALYRSCAAPADFDAALAERRQAVAAVEAMLADLREAEPFLDRATAGQVRSALLYQRSLFEVLEHYLTGMFHFYRYLDRGGNAPDDRRAALDAFARLREAWTVHTQYVPLLPGAATPYRDAGMGVTVEGAIARMGGRR